LKNKIIFNYIMCYSKNASIISFTIMFTISLYLFIQNKTDYRIIAVILFGVSTMQIAELLIHLDPNCDRKLNRFGSIFGLISLGVIQPIFSLLAAVYFGKIYKFKYNIYWILLWIVLYLIYICLLISTWPSDNQFCTNEKTSDRKLAALEWPWTRNNVPYIYAFYWLLVFVYPALTTSTPIFWIILTVVFNPIIQIFDKHNRMNESASCFWAPLLALFAVVFNINGIVSNKTYQIYKICKKYFFTKFISRK
jgi:hypothetical protein